MSYINVGSKRLKDAEVIEIASGVIAPAQEFVIVQAESGTTDALTTINLTNMSQLTVNGTTYQPSLRITADTDDTITVTHGTSANEIQLANDTNIDITDGDYIDLQYNGTNWVGQAGGSGSGTVTSVGLSTDVGILTVGSSPVTSSGTITLNKTSGLTANQFLASPDGTTGVVSMRDIVAGDVHGIGVGTDAVAYYETAGSADASWTLSGWDTATTYTELLIDLWVRPTATATLYVRPNSDTTAGNYYGMTSIEFGTATTTNAVIGSVATITHGTNYFDPTYDHPFYLRIAITRHNNTGFQKNFTVTGSGYAGGTAFTYTSEGWWESTSAMTSLYVAFSTGNLNLGSGYRVRER